MKGLCIDCVHYQREEKHFYNDNILKAKKCLAGNDEKMHQWWSENAKKTRENCTTMECYEPTKGVQILDSMLEDLKKIKNILENT